MDRGNRLTMGDLISGNLITFDSKEGMTAVDFMNAIDLHCMQPLILAYDELDEIVNELPDNNLRGKAFGYLAVIRNAIILLDRMGKEAMRREC